MEYNVRWFSKRCQNDMYFQEHALCGTAVGGECSLRRGPSEFPGFWLRTRSHGFVAASLSFPDGTQNVFEIVLWSSKIQAGLLTLPHCFEG
ncbi:hypothetical protein KPH14_005611 [Odynerus spinipes]|uniref:Uncharacterized protein n=1 Tax=Odynerus spinipes TaxID=1348599 RepID=A0AAD9VIV2_9HYME|nr:hypothetical protein KPH14_005611 [Odynerus spinipes]